MPKTIGGFGTSLSHVQCTAMSKRSGVQCKGPAILGSTTQKCRMHGGNSSHAIGTRNNQFKSGRYSKFLPSDMDELYREALANPDLIEMSDHIALLEARIQSVLGEADEGEPVPKWSDIATAFQQIESAVLSGKAEDVKAGIEYMHSILESGMKWDRTWNEVGGTVEQLRKLTDTEVKRRKELNMMVPIERVTILMGAVGDAVKRHVTNPAEIEAVYRDIARLYGTNTVESRGPRVGPEVIDVNPDRRGVSGGGSKPAIRRKKVATSTH